jgi:hypothetical protein
MIGMAGLGDTAGLMFISVSVVVGLVAAYWVARRLYKSLWMSGAPAELMGIRFLDDPPPPISPLDPEPPK